MIAAVSFTGLADSTTAVLAAAAGIVGAFKWGIIPLFRFLRREIRAFSMMREMVVHEFSPDNGKSIKDIIQRVDLRIQNIETRVENIERSVSHLWRVVNDTGQEE
jgi:hypothetical protein